MDRFLKYIYFFVMIILGFIIIFLHGRSYLETKQYQKIQGELQIVYRIPRDEGHLIPKEKEKVEVENEENHDAIEDQILEFAYESAFAVDYGKMKQINPDYIGWIYIPGTEISYPVVQYSDNDFYLHRSFDTKTYAYAGTVFLDAFAEDQWDEDNAILYGHNMKNGSMFGSLKKLKQSDIFEECKYIEIHIENEIRVYEIFSVREVSSDINSLNYRLTDFDLDEYIENAKSQSIQYREPSCHSNMLSLSTCVGNDARRFMVSAMLISCIVQK